eukprot:g2430.t1
MTVTKAQAPRFNRWLLITLNSVQVFTSGGVIFGWASLQQVLSASGVYASYCRGGGVGGNAWHSDRPPQCGARDTQLQMIFTVASSANMVANLLSGLVMDRWGPRVCKLFSHACIITGSAMLALWTPDRTDGLVLPAMSLIGYGGTGLELASIHISNLFPDAKSLATCVIVGCFQLSFFVFFVFRMLYKAGVPIQTIFAGYAALGAVNFVVSAITEPDELFAAPAPAGAGAEADAEAGRQPGQGAPAPAPATAPASARPLAPGAAAHVAAPAGGYGSCAPRARFQTPTAGTAGAAGAAGAAPPPPPRASGSSPGRFSMLRLPSRWTHGGEPASLLAASPLTPMASIQGSPPAATGGGAAGGAGTGAAGRNKLGRMPSLPALPEAPAPRAASPQKRPALASERVPLLPPSPLRRRHAHRRRPLPERSFRAQVCSPPFLFLLFFFCMSTLWANFFVGTVSVQLDSIVSVDDPRQFSTLLSAFNILLPTGAISIPLIGHLLDTRGFVPSIFVTIGCGLVYSVGMVLAWGHLHSSRSPQPGALLTAFVCYSLFRTFLFAVTFAYIGAKFGYRRFGALSGVQFVAAAAIGLLQYPINSWGEFVDINIVQLICLAATLSFPCYEWCDERRQAAANARASDDAKAVAAALAPPVAAVAVAVAATPDNPLHG